MSIKDTCDGLRVEILHVGHLVRNMIYEEMDTDQADYREVRANIMLSYRHLEDARMRLGKVIQALEGGTSVYDK